METSPVTVQDTVKALYNAFGTGNIPFILDHVAENFSWFDPCDPAIVPFGGMHKNKSGFLEFFQQMGGSTDTILWEVNDYISDGDKLVALGRHGIRCKKTGKEAIADWAMAWNFKDGVPSSGRSYYNNAGFENAFR